MNAFPSLPLPPTGIESVEDALRRRLKSYLLSLSYQAFQHCMHELLTRMGYSETRMLSRKHSRGRTRHGGRDLEAVAETGITRSLVIVQVKQYRRPVSRRFVDEMQGACLRTGARQGLIITTSTFSRAARSAAASNTVAPVRLLDGEELLDHLVRHRLGVSSDGETLDEGFFEGLTERFPLSTPGIPQKQTTNNRNRAALLPRLWPRKAGDMMWRTHVLIGINFLWLLEPFPGALTGETLAPLVVLSGFGALLPDLDAAEAKIKYLGVGGMRPLLPLSLLIHRLTGHRGVLHSLLGLSVMGVLSAVFSLWWGWEPSLALWLGYASHLAADACTRTGIPFLFPRPRRYFLLPRIMRFVTGSQAEEMLLPFLAMAVLLLLLSHFPLPTTNPDSYA